ncbi:MAG TPA: glycosyl hydrolase [Gemmatimonadaceae bacterium]|nr:glycosyl hydrolase [Gemmatimonadaceae bacterium]
MIGSHPGRLIPLAAPALAALLVLPPRSGAQSASRAPQPARALYDSTLFATLKWREVGPYRGGRSVAAAGSAARPYEYWMGTTGGGVFKTTDGGITWTPASDKHFGGPIGAIGVAESNPDIVYVATGESPIRGNVTYGDGIFKTTDGGKKWSYVGLKEARQIARVEVHPTNPDIVYVAAQGAFWGPTPDRGIYKSTDGAKTWKKVLFRGDSAGAVDLVMDPADPNTLYATFWQSYRTAWKMESGGKGSGIFKSTDGGETWTDLTRSAGLPKGLLGKIGITVSAAERNRLWALVEADDGGVFRSDDGGKTWTRTNDERRLRQRAWYYSRIFADPKDRNTVYALNTGFYKSTDGGKTFKAIPVPHGDNHDLWIAPNDPQRMIEANDGGANVSFNGGKSWSEQDYATAQFYHVTTTNEFPYRICGAQQDNSTLCGPSRWPGGIGRELWVDAGGGESGYIAVDPRNPDIAYAGSYGGLLTRKDMRTEIERQVNPWPDNPMGYSSKDITYRFQWTFPIVFSPHDPTVLYAGGNHVFRTTNGGESWDIISPDLTRHDPKTMEASGGPITKDQTGVETYATIFTIAESPREKGVIWTGSDDGLVYVTRDNGGTWKNVTPKGIGDFTRVSLIEASPHAAGTAYVAANRYQFGDLQPIIFRTTDYGATWSRIDGGIARDEPTRAVREDPERKGLLYAATERGVWVSFDDGSHWQSLKLDLPIVPVHDLVVKEGDLVIATHGRSFYVLDDLSALRQLTPEVAAKPAHLFKPADAYRVRWGGGFGGGGSGHPSGKNPAEGALVYYTLAKPGQEVTLEFLDAKGAVIQRFTSALDSAGMADSVRADSVKRARADSLKAIGKAVPQPETGPAAEERPDFEEMMRRGPRPPRVANKAGLNSFAWNLRYPDAARFANLIMWAGNTTGPMVAPGTYAVRLTVNGESQTQRFTVKKDPRTPATQADLDEQVAFLLKIRDTLSAANNAVRTIRNVKAQLDDRVAKAPAAQRARLEQAAKALAGRLSAVEEEIYQVRNQSSQDPLNYPIKLNNKIAALANVVGGSDGKPTKQSYMVFDSLTTRLDRQLDAMHALLGAELGKVNQLVAAAGLPAIVPSTAEVAEPRVAAGEGEEELLEKNERRKW